MSQKLADLIFPDVVHTPEYYEELYPPRLDKEGKQVVTVRFAPSPTGFIHIGGLYTALINMMVAKQSFGNFILRIEDTDQKRLVEHGVREIITSLEDFGITFTEGATGEDSEKGVYGPYMQSKRGAIYRSFAHRLVTTNDAYPCFCTPEELSHIREVQIETKSPVVGYAENYAACRHLSEEEAIRRIENGEHFIVRLRSRGTLAETQIIHDELRGDLEMPVNNQDIVIIKGDGLPTYHFAHVIDDHLMRTTHVIRADEWISSLPIHIELLKILGFQPFRYCHLSPIMKLDGSSKRKLSKRKDNEARVSFYREKGYPEKAVIDYLMNIANSGFEDWRRAHPLLPSDEYPFDIKKSSISGALFDFDKLDNIAKNVIANLTPEEIKTGLQKWLDINANSLPEEAAKPQADIYASYKSKQILQNFVAEPETDFNKFVAIWHENRLDVAKYEDILLNYAYLYNAEFLACREALPESFKQKSSLIKKFLEAYLANYAGYADGKAWFSYVRETGVQFGFAAKTGEYKKHPENYEGSIADISSYLRFAITGTLNSPDLFAIIDFIGAAQMQRRVEHMVEIL